MYFVTLDSTKIELSKNNVRKSTSKAAMDELKASILAHGLMQNIIVKSEGAKFRVVAGSRRFQAITELQKEGKLPKTFQINCQAIDEEDSHEMSIAENVVREAMHPADEFEAFAELLKDKKKTIASVALRFGCTPRHVEQRLKLGNVAPEIMKLFREGKIDLSCIQAFTVNDDHKKQVSVYKSLQSWERNSQTIKDKLTSKMFYGDSAEALFIGKESYLKAGGTIREDLFDKETFFEKGDLLQKLVHAKMAVKIEALKKEGWGFVEIEKGYEFICKFQRLDKKPKDLKNCGVNLYLNRAGKLEITMLKKIGKESSSALKKTEKKKPEISQALEQDLAEYRREIIQCAISSKPLLALDMLIFDAVLDMLNPGSVYSPDRFASVSFTKQRTTAFVQKDITDARGKMKIILEGCNLKWKKESNEIAQFVAFCNLKLEEKLQLLAVVYSSTLKPGLAEKGKKNSYETALGLSATEVSDFWRPTKENYFQRITIDQLDKIGKEVFKDLWKPKSLKKPYLVTLLSDAFKNPDKAANGSMDVQSALETWLPSGMGFTPFSSVLKKDAA